MEKEKKGRAIALLPIGVFLIIFLGAGIVFKDFYAMPAIVAFLIALFVAFLQNKELSFNKKIEVIAKGVGEENIITMSLIFLLIRFRMNWIPPCSFTSDTIHATIIEITVMSYIDVTPFPTTWNISESAICPMLTPTIREITIPLIKTTNTLIPISAPRRTTIYGRTSQRL